MIIDGVNLSDFLAIPGDRSPSRSASTTRQIISGAPGAWHRRLVGRDVPDALPIRVRGHVVGTTLANLRSNIDQLKWTVRPDTPLAIRWSDYAAREWIGYRELLQIHDIVPGWVTDGVAFELLIRCPDPFARDTSLQNETTSGAAPLVLTPSVGTAPMPVIITVTGNGAASLVNPVLHYRNGADADVITISYAGSLNGSQTLIIDTEFFTAEVNGANVGGSISGSYFDVNPGDGDYLGSPTGPDVQLTADSGTADDFQADYKRRYW